MSHSRWVLDTLSGRGAAPPRGFGPTDWDRSIAFAESVHAALPFAVEAGKLPELPEEAALKLREIEGRERMRLALLDLELEAALGALKDAGIPVMLIKGADLGRRFYPERILRPMGDVDLLVPAESYPGAWRALGAAGFAATERRYEHSFRSALARAQDGPSIDLHFKLISGDSPERSTRIWRRSVRGVFGDLGAEVSALSTEDCLVYVLRHSAVLHVLEGAIWLRDLDLIVRRAPRLDWDFVLAELRETRSQAAGYLVFGLLAEHFGTPIPPEVLAALRSRAGWLRRAAAGLRPGLEHWFPEEERSLGWRLSSRYLLRDSAAEALRFALERWSRKRRERLLDGG